MIKKIIKVIRSYFWKTPEENLNNDYDDKFRIKIIELRNNNKKYYPEYKEGMMSSWAQLVLQNNKGIVSIFLSDRELIEDNLSHCDSVEESKDLVQKYKQQLIKKRELELLKEQIIKL